MLARSYSPSATEVNANRSLENKKFLMRGTLGRPKTQISRNVRIMCDTTQYSKSDNVMSEDEDDECCELQLYCGKLLGQVKDSVCLFLKSLRCFYTMCKTQMALECGLQRSCSTPAYGLQPYFKSLYPHSKCANTQLLRIGERMWRLWCPQIFN